MRGKLLLWFMLFSFSGAVLAYEAPGYGTKYFMPVEEVITPHIKWLKPSVQEPIKVLFLGYRLNGGFREIVEISQRMDIKYDVFASDTAYTYLQPHYAIPKGITTELYDTILKEKLSGNYDVIVSGIGWNTLPLWAKYELLKKIKEGTNFLYYQASSQDTDEYLNRATTKPISVDLQFVFPYKGLPAFEKYKSFDEFINTIFSGYSFGNGKIFILKNYVGGGAMQMLCPVKTKTGMETDYSDYDYYLAFIIKCIQYAAGKQPECKIKGADYVKADYGKELNIEFNVDSQKEKNINYNFVIRKKSGEQVITGEKNVKINTGRNTIVLNCGNLPAGLYYADIWLKEKDKIIDFGSCLLDIVSEQNIDTIEMKTSFKKEENINGKIILKPPEGNLSLKIEHRDNFNRLLQQQTLPVNNKEIIFTLPPSHYLTVINHLEVQLIKDGKTIAEKKQKFLISNIEPKNDFRTILWCAPITTAYTSYHLYNIFYKAGIDTIYPLFADIITMANLDFIGICDSATPFFSDRKSPRDPSDHVRLPCLSDPETLKKLEDALNKDIDKVKEFSVSEFTMGDELHFALGNNELCFSPHCQKKFQDFLGSEYKTIQNLNKEYNSNYASFSDVKPITFQQAMQNPDLIPLWVDYRRCMEDVWAGTYKYAADIIKKKIPYARVGYEGTDAEINTFRATDFYKMMNAINLNGCYTRPFIDHAIKDFAQPGSLLSFGWSGGYDFCRNSKLFNYYFEWRNLFKGANCAFLWTGFPGQNLSITASDFSFYDFFKINLAQLNEIKNGIGKIFMESKREDDQTAILYSASSVHMATLSPRFPTMQQVLDSLITAMEDTHRQFKIISYKQLEEGILGSGNFKFLYLPFTQSLSQKEATEIIEFVRNGGTLIADLRPGVCDEHGKPYNKGILDEVFGISQNTKNRAGAEKANITISAPGFPEKIPATTIDSTLGLAAGQAKGYAENVPVMVVNSYGKGQAILLNFTMKEYASVKGELEKGKLEINAENAMILKKFFDDMWTFAGNKKCISVSPDNIPGLKIYRYKSGNNIYLGILQEVDESIADKEFKAELVLPQKGYVYDTREGKFLGYTNKINTTFCPIKPRVYSLLPYKVNGINLTVPVTVSQGETFSYSAEILASSSPGFHVFHVVLFSPSGEEVKYYSKNMSTINGKIQDKIFLALNETKGTWKIKITDVATGIFEEKTFNIK